MGLRTVVWVKGGTMVRGSAPADRSKAIASTPLAVKDKA